jgi:hypothetical protein
VNGGGPLFATLIAGLLALQTPSQTPTATPTLTATGSATATLISLYDNARDADAKETIVRHLAERGDPAAIAKVIAIAKSDADNDLRQAAIRQIAK